MSVSDRFQNLLRSIELTDTQRIDGETKQRGVRRCLNKHYWGQFSDASNSWLVGSWGKGTQVRPPRDIDILFVLPDSVMARFDFLPHGRNGQSMLLQEVKGVLAKTYPDTTLRADGQVVLVPFASFCVEVVPAFRERDQYGEYTDRFLICDTNNGGSYRLTAPADERAALQLSDDRTKGNARDLVKMMKRWQTHCNVDGLKSFVIELLVVEFLKGWDSAGVSTGHYDWMVREFFDFLVTSSRNWDLSVPGTGEIVSWHEAPWRSKAETAFSRAKKALAYESDEVDPSRFKAWIEWKKIFGDDVPFS